MPNYKPIEERFIQYVNETDACWEWFGSTDSCGYGMIRLPHHGRMVAARRWFWEYLFGSIPEGKLLCHTCDNPPCVRLDHLYVGTQQTNARDREYRGRGGGLGGHPFSIKQENWRCIQYQYHQGSSIKELIKKYKVSRRTIFRILERGKNATKT